jgi:hypothetical protein
MRRRRSFKRTFLTLLALAAVVYFGAMWFLRSAYAVEQVTNRFTAALGAPVKIAGLNVGLSRSSVAGLAINERGSQPTDPPWLTTDSVDADLSLMQLIRGELADGTITLRHVHVILHFDHEGRLLTRLPEPTGEEGGALPVVRLVDGEFTIRRDGRADETIHKIDLELRPDGPKFVLSGTVDDPDWGPWTVAGSRMSQSSPLAFNLKTRESVHVTPALLKRTPFVPDVVWNQVTCEGDTPCEVAVQFNANPPLNYRVTLEPRNTRVYVPSIDLRADGAQGKVTIADDVLTLENVRGRSAGGELKVRSIMDFRGIASVMKFTIEAGLLSLAQLPAHWGVPSLRGELSGKADLEVTSAKTGTIVKGDGEGSVRVPLLPVAVKIHLTSDGRRLRFNLVRD